MTLSRRSFLRCSAAAIGAGGAGTLAHLVGGRAVAQPSGLAGEGAGAIIIVLNGGARSQCVFNGAVGSGVNPFGQLDALTVPLSGSCADSGLERAELNRYLNTIVTAQHHTRTANHGPGRTVACTGFPPEEGKPGILTILNRVFSFREIPCVNIGNDTPTTDIGTEIASTFAPIKIRSPLDVDGIASSILDVSVSDAEQARLDALRGGLSDRFLRSTSYRSPAEIPFFQRRAAEVAARLDDDALDIRSEASMGRYLDGADVPNATLRAAFGVDADGGGNSMGAMAMLALRLRQLGCAGITLSSDANWDLHSGEEAQLPVLARQLGQALAGLIEHLSSIQSPVGDGRTLLDTTVVTVVSDFGRGNWSNGTGFNGNRGSDHVGDEDKTCFQAIPIFGGGLPGGRVLGEVRSDGSPAASAPVYETRQILATVLDLVGVPPAQFLPDAVRPLTEELAG